MERLSLLLTAALLGACGAAAPTPAPAVTSTPAAALPADPARIATNHRGGPVAPVARGPIAIGPGLRPDPAVLHGRAGGPVEATMLDPGCRGFLPSEPQLELDVMAPIPYLRILVRCAVDATLVVQGPQGYACNDDSEGLNPIVQQSFAPGHYRVFVGTYSPQPMPVPYTLGLSEDLGTTVSGLP